MLPRNIHLGVFLTVCLCPCFIQSATFQDENALRNSLFVNYSKQIRPVVDQSSIVFVYVNFTLYSIQQLDSKNQVLTTTASLGMTWKNELLTWRKEEYGGIEDILVLPSQVWIPDIVVYNGARGHNFMGSDDYLIRLFNDGSMLWFPGSVLETQCSIVVAKYPFDTQICDIEFSMWMHPAKEVQLVSILPETDITLFSVNGEWEMANNSVQNASIQFEAPYSFLKAKLYLKRRPAYHVINTVLPILILSILNVLVFVLPPEAGEKMSLAITVLLAYAVFLSIINENMPTISTSVSILAVYMVLILALGTMSTFLSAVVLHYAYNEEGRERRFFSTGCIRARRNPAKDRRKESLAFVHHACEEADKNKGNGIVSDEDKATSGAEADNVRAITRDYHTSLINPKARDLVDKIDVTAFWLFLAVTILLFIVIIAVLCAPGL